MVSKDHGDRLDVLDLRDSQERLDLEDNEEELVVQEM